MAGAALASEHLLRLFDTIESRADTIGAYVKRGLAANQHVVLFAKSAHWKAADKRLSSGRRCVGSAFAAGRLTVLDAHETLDEITKQGLPDRARFSACIARAIPQNRRPQKCGVRVYGEIVDLLAEELNFAGVISLEKLWNDQLKTRRFTLMCGYSSAHFGNPLARSALRAICRCHSRIERAEDDSLGSFLIAESQRRG
jgi:hypothetical protein